MSSVKAASGRRLLPSERGARRSSRHTKQPPSIIMIMQGASFRVHWCCRIQSTADGIDILPWRRFTEELWSDAMGW